MYPNVKAEFARLGLTLDMVAKEMGRSVGSLSMKMRGKSPLLLKEAVMIKRIIRSDKPIEELFEEAE